MPKIFTLGKLAGLTIQARPSALVYLLLLAGVLAGLGAYFFALPAWAALLGGLTAALLHAVGELFHNLSHAYAAHRTGHPMSGVLFWGLLASSRYPANEGELPAGVHIRRAIGGPIGSALLAALAGLLAYGLPLPPGLPSLLAQFFFWDNLLVFALGALAPLPFTDGGTILYWIRRS